MNTRRKPSRTSQQSNKGRPCVPAAFVCSVRKQGWGETLERINGPVVRNRSRNTTDRLRRYERMLRYRLAMLQIHRGSRDEAIAQWPALDDESCLS